MRLLMISNTAWSLVNFRLGLARHLRDTLGHEVILSAPCDGYEARLGAEGFRFLHLPMDGQSTGPVTEVKSLLAIRRMVRSERPDALLLFTPKPNIYGGLVARMTGTRALHNVAGLGRMFLDPKSPKARAATWLYRLAMHESDFVFFQNDRDRDLLLAVGGVRPERSQRIFGSGVDTETFHPRFRDARPDGAGPRFLMFARLLKPKGVAEYAEAAKRLRARHPEADCALLGPTMERDPDGFSAAEIAALARECGLSYLGASDDVRAHLARTDCVVLPSYYGEGVPRSLLETAAMGIPIITTDSVGCRDAVEDGVSGWLVPPRAVAPLADAMAHVATLSPDALGAVGRAARHRAETLFHETAIFDAYRQRL